MTEELEKEAEEYALEKCKECYMCNSEENGERGYCPKFESRKEGYLASAEPREKRIAELEAQIEKMQETLKSDLIARLKEDISYSTSPSCTKGMELFIESIEEWEIKEK